MGRRDEQRGPSVERYLVVTVGHHECALRLDEVARIRDGAAVEPDGAGVVVGRLAEEERVPVLDLGRMLDSRRLKGATPVPSVVVLHGGGEEVAVRVDSVGEIVELRAASVHPVERLEELRVELVAGLTLHPFPLVVLDHDALVAACRQATDS